jgi:hypothetical protein
MAIVKILHRWDGKSRLDLAALYVQFKHDNYCRLTKKVVKPTILINNPKLARQTKLIEQFLEQRKHNEKTGDNIILWIEKLLKTPIPDHRKYCIWRILAPYLINVKHLSFDEAFDIIDKWLDRCNNLEKLDFDSYKYR